MSLSKYVDRLNFAELYVSKMIACLQIYTVLPTSSHVQVAEEMMINFVSKNYCYLCCHWYFFDNMPLSYFFERENYDIDK